MEPNGLGCGLFPSNINNGFLGVENQNPLKQQQNLQNQQNPHTLNHPQMVSYSTHHHHHPYNSTKNNNNHNKPQTTTLSDEDEPGFAADENPKRKGSGSSPWHRMKWTDTMVRLLIMAVYYIGDNEVGNSEGTTDKKKATGNLLQKKGKWKSVSRGMMEKGYYVSPQQCEDKFNDLNKRYKRVNDILGKGTACRVVENQTLLDTMDLLSPKMKEEARKLLNSKHLFFREMCAYHNSCGHGGSGTSSETQQPQQQQQQQQKPCLYNMMKERNGEEEEEEDEDEDDEWEDYSEEEEEESGEGSKGQVEEDENNNNNNHVGRKRSRKVSMSMTCSSSSPLMQQLSSEVMVLLQDGVKSGWEKKQWMKKKVVQLGEQQVSYQVKAFEMEKQRLKWVRFSSNKEREMERQKLENERKRLEIERMVLMLRQKELELVVNSQQQQQQHSST